MTKLTVNTDFEKGVSSKQAIEKMKAGHKKESASGLPKIITDILNLTVCALVGGGVAWITLKFLT